MEFMGKKIEDLVVTLPFADGTEQDCGVFACFTVNSKAYFALKPLGADGKPDPSQSFLIYRVTEDAEGNPVVEYIENDLEYAVAARYFSDNYLH